MRRRILLSTATATITLAVLLGIGASARADGAAAAVPAEIDNPARTISTFVAASSMREWTLSLSGMLVARDEIAIGSPLQDQRIASVAVEVGDRVVAGQLLMRLETGMLENQLREAEGRVARAGAALAQQEATLVKAENSLDRAGRLRTSRTISEETYEERLSAVTISRQAVAVERAEHVQAEALLAEAQRRLERAEILAPAAGIVSERLARAGALVGTEPLVRLIRDGEIELAAEIPESDMSLLAVGQTVTVRIAGQTGRIAGRVRMIGPKIDRETRLGTAQIALETDAALFPGTFGRADIVILRQLSIVIDDSALLYGDTPGEVSVFVVDQGHVVRRPVEAGMRQGGKVEIRAGLRAGERVVAKAGASLREGDAVTTIDLQSAFESHH